MLFAVDTQAESTGSAHKFVDRELEQLVQDKRCSGVTKHSWTRPGLYVKKGGPGPCTVYDYDMDGKQRALELLLRGCRMIEEFRTFGGIRGCLIKTGSQNLRSRIQPEDEDSEVSS